MGTSEWLSHPLGQLPRRAVRQLFHGESRFGLRFLSELLLRYRWVIATVLLTNLIIAACESSTMGLMMLALRLLLEKDALLTLAGTSGLKYLTRLTTDPWHVFMLVLGVAVLVQLVRTGLQLLGNTLVANLRTAVELDLRKRTFRQLMAIPFGSLVHRKIGDLLTYFQHVIYGGELVQSLNEISVQALVSLALIGVLVWISWGMTLLTLVTLTLLSWPISLIVRLLREAAAQRIKSVVAINEAAGECLQGMRLIRASCQEESITAKFDGVLVTNKALERRGLICQAATSPIFEAIAVTGVAALMILGSFFFQQGPTSAVMIPQLLAFLFILHRILPRIQQLQNRWGSVIISWPVVCRMASFLRADSAALPRGRGQPPSPFRTIEFRQVTLQYRDGEPPALRNLALTIPWGQRVALVGTSGGGKSSIADLLLRFYDCTRGQILVDGVDVNTLDVKQWRDTIGVVSQDSFVFNATIRDNIAFGCPAASAATIEDAARRANAHDFIMHTTGGYDTVVGERGVRLSAGQRQRLAIARALLRPCQLLIFDEATSNLDLHSEQIIQQSLAALRGQRTMLIIAHRLSTIAAVDHIVVLEEGQVIEQGRHDDLLAQHGRYRQLWQLQTVAPPSEPWRQSQDRNEAA